MRVVIYGAVATPPSATSLFEKIRNSIKRSILLTWDPFKMETDGPLRIDYKRYINHHSRNAGDVAITEAISGDFLYAKNGLNIEYCDWGDLPAHKRATPLTSNDWLVVGGSGYIQFSEDGSLPKRIASDLEEIAKTNVNVIIHGIGVNSPHHISGNLAIANDSEILIKEILGCAKFISVRDRFSHTLLSKYTQKKIALTGDPALHIARKYHLKSDVSQRDSMRRIVLQVGLNFALHGPTSNQLLNRNFSKYIGVLKQLQSEWNCQYCYFVHYDSELIIPRALSKHGIAVKVVNGSIEELVNEYAKLDLHIGNMLHSCILAHSLDIPTIALAYDIKHLGFFELFSLQENCLSAHEFSEVALLERARSILSDPALTIMAIKKVRKQLQICNDEFISQAIHSMHSR